MGRGLDRALAAKLRKKKWTLSKTEGGEDAKLKTLGISQRAIKAIRAGGRSKIPFASLASVLIANRFIRSVADDGKPLWIEVKSTAGRDGNFIWAKNEFQKALQEGSHYELRRVYEATSEHPLAKRFPDPVNLVTELAFHGIDTSPCKCVGEVLPMCPVRCVTHVSGRSQAFSPQTLTLNR